MATKELESQVKALPGGDDFMDSVDRLSIPELNARISQMQKDLDESESHKENNEELKRAKEEVKELTAPYRDVRNAIKVKTKYIITLIKDKGGE